MRLPEGYEVALTADVSPFARLGRGTRVWGGAQVREDAVVGEDCVLGRGVYVDRGVQIGDRCKIQNDALVYAPAALGDGVFIGPAAILTNDRYPRAVKPDGELKAGADWDARGVTVKDGAAIGAGAVVVAGVTVGRWAMVAAGAVVSRDVPDHALVAGVPGRQIGWVGKSGRQLRMQEPGILVDPETHDRYRDQDGELVAVS